MTVVEALLQIFLLHTDARILVATPTNSSADLIVTRLVKSGKIKVGLYFKGFFHDFVLSIELILKAKNPLYNV